MGIPFIGWVLITPSVFLARHKPRALVRGPWLEVLVQLVAEDQCLVHVVHPLSMLDASAFQLVLSLEEELVAIPVVYDFEPFSKGGFGEVEHLFGL
ncbi:MAG TPA: hypothetical protein PKI27_16660 [Dermatophilaceae bacterium]|nr:hypothetical protein [Dermatophilaceae bacterium]